VDPDKAYAMWLHAWRMNMKKEARHVHEDLSTWIRNGGFEPQWSRAQRAAFMTWHEDTEHPSRCGKGQTFDDANAELNATINRAEDDPS
jgi:hypothetical protein